MPFTTSELTKAGKAALDFYVKNKPVDQVAIERPWWRALQRGKRQFPGGKQFVVEQLRYRYQSNFEWYYGDQQVSYNKRDSLKQAFFPWRACHDGYSLNEDELLQNGITIHDGPGRVNSGAERLMLTNLLEENSEILREGFEEKIDQAASQDGTQDTDAIEGRDLLIDTDPTTGTVGGINRATSGNEWWRNNYVGSLSQSTLIENMEIQWRACSRNGGAPNYIEMGSTMLDAFRAATKGEVSRYTILSTTGQAPQMDAGVGSGSPGGVRTGLHFHNVEIHWNPTFSELDTLLTPTPTFEKRCYFHNLRFVRVRPAIGHDMITRMPPRVYDRYAYYWGLTWKGAMCMSRGNAHSVLSLS